MSESHLFIDADMARAAALDLGAHQAVVFSSPKPGRSGPNEDAAALVSLGAETSVAVVSDGAGGHRGGAEAAAIAVRAICSAVLEQAHDPDGLRSAVINGFEAADRAVAALGSGAAATLAAVEVRGTTLRAYHVGDSMVLVTGQRGRIKWLTIPHSPVGYAVEAGLLDREDALHHEDLHVVSNMVGMPGMRIEIGASVELAPRDTVVVASDGLSDNVHLEEIVERVRKGPLVAATEALWTLGTTRMTAVESEGPSKPDDFTLIALRPRAQRACAPSGKMAESPHDGR